ncbi:hypothetical protein [Aurantimicrobium minutum]|uniref:hypothetical protein n=1 Tax=Aurantimicrobium minutum TaxID=708131 RepID=UPI002472FDD3|nr:hypothetical protein [Aurantimicrobium minutum]MDH6535986.1 putative membrane protein [Aurantimicrobium minutum]
MTKRVHPAESARKLVGVASGVALVGIVTGFQLSANAQESEQAQQHIQGTPAAVAPAAGATQAPASEAAPEAVPAPVGPSVQQVAVPQVAAPAAEAPVSVPAPAAPVEAPAPAVVAPAPAAPDAPVNGTTAGSGG